ncbi:uncharacterized protein LOC108962483 [Serinus canaria]|uniref:uncharacterized protein LOC108962483 n=1 Tax=Serinus canaria TaxID=9135 RepID=UPI0021CD0215|nr:uncharacterized protein LOC108962483 [Serinus canaria]
MLLLSLGSCALRSRALPLPLCSHLFITLNVPDGINSSIGSVYKNHVYETAERAGKDGRGDGFVPKSQIFPAELCARGHGAAPAAPRTPRVPRHQRHLSHGAAGQRARQEVAKGRFGTALDARGFPQPERDGDGHGGDGHGGDGHGGDGHGGDGHGGDGHGGDAQPRQPGHCGLLGRAGSRSAEGPLGCARSVPPCSSHSPLFFPAPLCPLSATLLSSLYPVPLYPLSVPLHALLYPSVPSISPSARSLCPPCPPILSPSPLSPLCPLCPLSVPSCPAALPALPCPSRCRPLVAAVRKRSPASARGPIFAPNSLNKTK